MFQVTINQIPSQVVNISGRKLDFNLHLLALALLYQAPIREEGSIKMRQHLGKS